MDNKEFNRIFETIGKSNTMIPSRALLTILGGIVNSSSKDSEDVIKYSEALKDCETPDLVSKTILFTCNSIIINLWKTFGPQFEEAYKKELAKAEATEADKEPEEDHPKQDA